MLWLLPLFVGYVAAQNVLGISGCLDNGAVTTICPTNTPITFTITGTGFNPNSVASIGGQPCSLNGRVPTPTRIICTFTAPDTQHTFEDAAGTNVRQFVSVSGSISNTVFATFTNVVFSSLTYAGAGPARLADPCNRQTRAKLGSADCTAAVRRPLTSSTLLLPSRGSEASTTRTQAYAAAAADGLVVTVTGMNLPRPGGVNNMAGFVGLSDGPSCDNGAVFGGRIAQLTATSATSATFTITGAFLAGVTDTEIDPRFLCWLPSLAGGGASAIGKWTGLAIGVTWDCDDTVAAKRCTARAADPTLSASQQMILSGRRTCCRTAAAANGVGQCINGNVSACCGSSSYQPGVQRCCNPNSIATNEVITSDNQPCPCTWPGAVAPLTCPLGEQCCLATKYAELSGNIDTNIQGQTQGECYNPISRQCCNTGHIYDPGSQQCCVINGLQSLDAPCSCGQNSDCQAGGRTNFACCMQTSPLRREAISAPTVAGFAQPMCNIYQSYPTGVISGAAAASRCPGSCINTDYQICCNGVACIHAFEKCCNATCCNQFTGSCNVAQRPAGTAGSQFNFNEFRVTYLQCSEIEHLHELKAFWIFVWPTYLLLMTLGTLALVVIFANKASSRQYSSLEQSIIASALFAIIFSLSLFFSPIYKYGMVVIFAHLLAILTAGVRVRSLNLLTVLVFAITVVYLFDPFHGNAYLTLAENRNNQGAIDSETMGIWHSTFRLWKTHAMTRDLAVCTNYYNYFRLDDALRDTVRFDNPLDLTWGYCNRGWIFALLMFEGFIILFTLLNFFLGIVALLLRFGQSQKAEEFPALQDLPY